MKVFSVKQTPLMVAVEKQAVTVADQLDIGDDLGLLFSIDYRCDTLNAIFWTTFTKKFEGIDILTDDNNVIIGFSEIIK